MFQIHIQDVKLLSAVIICKCYYHHIGWEIRTDPLKYYHTL